MKILIKKARVINPLSVYNNQVLDILIENGQIIKIDKEIKETTNKIIEKENLHVSVGFLDINARACDPGFEHKENFESLSKACIKGGYTEVAVSPETLPITQSKSAIEYVLSKTKNLPVKFYPLGAATEHFEGKELTELFDMHMAGAIGFTNGKNPIMHSGVLTRLLMYLKQFNGRLLIYADDKNLSANGQVHEGVVSTQLGLKSRPALAESIMINRDIQLAEFCDATIHFSTVSTAQSVSLINEAKKQNLKITCDVAAHHLLLTDEKLFGFDSVYKVLPPLRSEDHRTALIEAFKNGTIDAIVSDHAPQDIEEKNKEFDLAAYGAIGLQTSFSVALTALSKHCSLEKIVEGFTNGPRKVLGLQPLRIQVGETANLTLFDPEAEYIFSETQIVSLSKNSMFIGEKLKGKIYGTLLSNQINLL